MAISGTDSQLFKIEAEFAEDAVLLVSVVQLGDDFGLNISVVFAGYGLASLQFVGSNFNRLVHGFSLLLMG